MSSLEDKAAEFLRIKGWTVLEPPADVQQFAVGQVWASPRPRSRPRKIVQIGPHEKFGPNPICIHFVTIDPKNSDKVGVLRRRRWRQWIHDQGAVLQEGSAK